MQRPRLPAELTSRTHTTALVTFAAKTSLGLLLAGKVEFDRMATIWHPLAKQILGPSRLANLHVSHSDNQRTYAYVSALQYDTEVTKALLWHSVLQIPNAGVPQHHMLCIISVRKV
jgi:hypothetical protein